MHTTNIGDLNIAHACLNVVDFFFLKHPCDT
jgi:hypothetical protein